MRKLAITNTLDFALDGVLKMDFLESLTHFGAGCLSITGRAIW